MEMEKTQPDRIKRSQRSLSRFYRMEPFYDAAMVVFVACLIGFMAFDLLL